MAAQLGLKADDLLAYALREKTRHEHLAVLRRIYGCKSSPGVRCLRVVRLPHAEGRQPPRALASCSRRGARIVRVAVLLCVAAFGAAQADDTKASDALELTLEDAVGFALARRKPCSS